MSITPAGLTCQEDGRRGGGELPFAIAVGRCAVLEDPFGTVLCILDLSQGPRS